MKDSRLFQQLQKITLQVVIPAKAKFLNLQAKENKTKVDDAIYEMPFKTWPISFMITHAFNAI